MHNRLYQESLSPGPAILLENYPKTKMDVERAVRKISVNGHVVALLSVSSSGALRDRLIGSLRELQSTGLLKSWVLHILLDRQTRIDESGVTTWLPLRGQNPFAGLSLAGDDCSLCRTPGKAQVFAINPKTFHGMIPYQIKPLVPSPKDAHENRRFWELCSDSNATKLHERPEEAVLGHRPRDARMGIRFELTNLIASTELPDLAKAAFHKSKDSGIDLVLIPQHDVDRPGFANFWRELSTSANLPEAVIPFSVQDEWEEKLIQSIKEAHSILVFSVGIVTGASVQRALTRVQSIRKDKEFRLQCACIHARPATTREWQTLENSFDGDLSFAWLTHLPDRSPLEEEWQSIANVDPTPLSKDGRTFLEARLLFCSDSANQAMALFWGSKPEARLTPHSIFGEALDSRTTLAAVGSAMHRARLTGKQSGIPEWRVFEMPAIVRSYYDALILASVFRWLDPIEAWWGNKPGDAGKTVSEMLGRTSDTSHLTTLTCELALATYQGKIPNSAIDPIRAKSKLAQWSFDRPYRGPRTCSSPVRSGGLGFRRSRTRSRARI